MRNVWQIAPGDLKISGKSWATSFDGILGRVKTGLGCQDTAISATLYNLLVYGRGGFFLAHRDTEKIAGMFGTLVVTLPSLYRGGALRVRHGGREVTVETNASDPSEISFTAFYADCEHEALPVMEGHRVCLVYNLVQEQRKARQRLLKAPSHGHPIEAAAAILDSYWKKQGRPKKIAWLLEHQYSPAGLSFPALRGAHAAQCQVLAQAANRAKCAAHLGIVHIEETGGVDEIFDYGDRYRRGGYDDDVDVLADETVDFTAATADSKRQYVDEWRATDDRTVAFGRIPVRKGELLPAGALDEEPPDEKRLTEASGNEGASYGRSYHRAALVLWPAKQTISVLLQGGVVAAMPYLERLAASGQSGRREALFAARLIVRAWPADPDRSAAGGTSSHWERISLIAGTVSGTGGKTSGREAIFFPAALHSVTQPASGHRVHRNARQCMHSKVYGRARQSTCSGAARSLLSRLRTGISTRRCPAPAPIAANYRPLLAIPGKSFAVFASTRRAAATSIRSSAATNST